MGDTSTNYYYHPVAGSRDLVTLPAGARKELRKLENASPGEKIEFTFNGKKLIAGGTSESIGNNETIEGLKKLGPLEQLVYIHFHLLSLTGGSNWCRVGMSKLCDNTGLSRRRLMRALSGLSAAGLIKPIDRDRNGTLYIIYSLCESDSVVKKADSGNSMSDEGAHGTAERTKPVESPVNEEFYPTGKKIVTIREMAETFFKKTGIKHDDVKMDEAISQITYLLEDGFSREEVLKAINYIAKKHKTGARIERLPYIIEKAIEETGAD